MLIKELLEQFSRIATDAVAGKKTDYGDAHRMIIAGIKPTVDPLKKQFPDVIFGTWGAVASYFSESHYLYHYDIVGKVDGRSKQHKRIRIDSVDFKSDYADLTIEDALKQIRIDALEKNIPKQRERINNYRQEIQRHVDYLKSYESELATLKSTKQ